MLIYLFNKLQETYYEHHHQCSLYLAYLGRSSLVSHSKMSNTFIQYSKYTVNIFNIRIKIIYYIYKSASERYSQLKSYKRLETSTPVLWWCLRISTAREAESALFRHLNGN
jgi:hypothetical protein